MKTTISAERLAMVRTLLTASADLLVRQGTLGRSGSQCCNLNEYGSQCVVGLLVGPTHFEVGNSKMSNELSVDQYNAVFSGHIKSSTYEDLSLADKTAFRGILYYLQKIHDGLAASAADTGWSADRSLTLVFAGLVGQVLVSVEDETMYGYEAINPTVNFSGVRNTSCCALFRYSANLLAEIRNFIVLK